MKLRIMTYNIAGGRDHHELPAKTINPAAAGEVIKEFSPDIVGLNEVDFNHPRSGNINIAAETAHSTGIPYESRFARALELGRPGNRGSYGNALLSKYPVLLSEVISVPDPEDKSEDTYYETRCVFRNIILVEENKEIEVVVTHFGLAKTERAETMKILTKIMKESTRPLVIMGDFNVRSGSKDPKNDQKDEIKALFDNMTDSFKFCKDPECTLPSRFDIKMDELTYNDGQGVRIDYIFLSDDFTVENAKVPEVIASDHRPYFIDVTV